MRHTSLSGLAFVLGMLALPAQATEASDALTKALSAITGKEPGAATTAVAPPKAAQPAVAPVAAPAAPTPAAPPAVAPVAPPAAKAAPPVATAPEPAPEPIPEPPRPMPMGQRLEDKLLAAHDRLQLTSAQQAAWAEVSKVLQDNQKTASAVFRDKPGNAIDAVRQGIKAAETRIANLKRLGGVLEKFYAGLTESQQRTLDEALHPSRP